MKLSTKNLGLAAFMKANGAVFNGLEGDRFVFDTEIQASEWKLRHVNSCCRKVDIELIALRDLRGKARAGEPCSEVAV
jgi:hypothetical protein